MICYIYICIHVRMEPHWKEQHTIADHSCWPAFFLPISCQLGEDWTLPDKRALDWAYNAIRTLGRVESSRPCHVKKAPV